MKIINEKFPKIRSRTTGEFIKLYTDNLEQFHELLTFAEKTKFQFYEIKPKTAPHQGCTERTAPQLQGRRNSSRLRRTRLYPEKKNCHLNPSCLKCGEGHITRECPITERLETAYCINCEMYGHMANWRGCPCFPKPPKGTALNNRNSYTNIAARRQPSEDNSDNFPSTFRGAPGEDPLKWLKEYDRVANFNKWDDMMCLANVYFFLDGTARQWYVNNEDALDSWEAFKNGLSGLFGDRQRYTRRAEEQLKCRAQRSGESTQSYIQSVLGLCQEALLTREINDTASFIKWCNYIEDMKQKRVGRPRFERLPNVVPVASLTDETDLVSLIRTIVRERSPSTS
ncbi:CCHC-type domain-containing protein [Trichonephila clavipes]|nr:CCHC-type domain-containing protein [Trichonephila clavipes]